MEFVFKRLPLGLVKLLRWTGLIRWLDGEFQKWATEKSLQEVISGLTNDPHLRAALTFNGGDTGSSKSKSAHGYGQSEKAFENWFFYFSS